MSAFGPSRLNSFSVLVLQMIFYFLWKHVSSGSTRIFDFDECESQRPQNICRSVKDFIRVTINVSFWLKTLISKAIWPSPWHGRFIIPALTLVHHKNQPKGMEFSEKERKVCVLSVGVFLLRNNQIFTAWKSALFVGAFSEKAERDWALIDSIVRKLLFHVEWICLMWSRSTTVSSHR